MPELVSTISFSCPECEEYTLCDIYVPEPDFSGEKTSDCISEADVEVECENCGAGFDVSVVNRWGQIDAEIRKHPEIEIDATDAQYTQDEDDWEDYELPDNPYYHFRDAISHSSLILGKFGPQDFQGTINRMVFVQAFSALEAYLSDTLISSVLNDRVALARVLQRDKELLKQKFTLHEIYSEPKLIEQKVKAYLLDISYHNLGKVSHLYKNAFGISIKLEPENWERLHKAVSNRHDCVHRNGYTSDGEKPSIYSQEYIEEIMGLISQLVEKVETELGKYRKDALKV
ncbi:conserved hypothetical protein [Candidatus Terasakiella magnetica]|uniref:RiboL-PSP-HEPN domain-containing protein n=1 Tax=Candidatus Terasakiella magnetica TaxID=1867952 RepID=A0A1C3RF89_9PROT|nr:hypothetical protein [Candidatus Terasakiella magnetica]SCA55947.1 conserved hypothetical protein [Candidatus Terasakiella magnetica]